MFKVYPYLTIPPMISQAWYRVKNIFFEEIGSEQSKCTVLPNKDEEVKYVLAIFFL